MFFMEGTASRRSSKTDALILERIFLLPNNRHALESLIEATPDVCGSPLVNAHLFRLVGKKLQQVLYWMDSWI